MELWRGETCRKREKRRRKTKNSEEDWTLIILVTRGGEVGEGIEMALNAGDDF